MQEWTRQARLHASASAKRGEPEAVLKSAIRRFLNEGADAYGSGWVEDVRITHAMIEDGSIVARITGTNQGYLQLVKGDIPEGLVEMMTPSTAANGQYRTAMGPAPIEALHCCEWCSLEKDDDIACFGESIPEDQFGVLRSKVLQRIRKDPGAVISGTPALMPVAGAPIRSRRPRFPPVSVVEGPVTTRKTTKPKRTEITMTRKPMAIVEKSLKGATILAIAFLGIVIVGAMFTGIVLFGILLLVSCVVTCMLLFMQRKDAPEESPSKKEKTSGTSWEEIARLVRRHAPDQAKRIEEARARCLLLESHADATLDLDVVETLAMIANDIPELVRNAQRPLALSTGREAGDIVRKLADSVVDIGRKAEDGRIRIKREAQTGFDDHVRYLASRGGGADLDFGS